jgi:hypothetical protein
MNGTKLSINTLIFIFGATILVPVLLTGVAYADCGVCMSDWGGCAPCAYKADLLRCDLFTASDCDRCAGLDGNRAFDVDHHRGAVVNASNRSTEYRCDLYGCAWIR